MVKVNISQRVQEGVEIGLRVKVKARVILYIPLSTVK